MVFHCIIHQDALCCKIQLKMIEVTIKVTLRVDYTRRNGLNHPECQHCLEEVDQSRMTMHTTRQLDILIEVKGW